MFPEIGHLPIGSITHLQIIAALRKIETRGAHEVAHRVKATCARVFTYANHAPSRRKLTTLRYGSAIPTSIALSLLLVRFIAREEAYSEVRKSASAATRQAKTKKSNPS